MSTPAADREPGPQHGIHSRAELVDGKLLEQQQGGFDVSILLGGQVRTGRLRLFMIYSAGNFIEATADTPYLQIGEHKYGKPIMDRVVKYHIPLKAAAKAIIVSFDSTMRSNLTVGLPIDLLAYEKDTDRVTLRRRFADGDHYFSQLSGIWSAGLRRAFMEVPEIQWGDGEKE